MQNEEYKMKNKEKNFTDEIVCMVYCSYGAMILLMAAKEKMQEGVWKRTQRIRFM